MGNGEKGSEALSVSGAMALAKGALEGVTVRLMVEHIKKESHFSLL